MTNLSLTQGFPFYYNVQSSDYKLVFMDDEQKYILNATLQDDKYYIYADSSTTSGMIAGVYKYQLMNDSGITDFGYIQVKQNYAYIDVGTETKSQNELLLEAIDAQIAGKATSAQSNMRVGDKSIQYCSIDELFKLRNHFQSLVAKEHGENDFRTNGGKIKYIWSIR